MNSSNHFQVANYQPTRVGRQVSFSSAPTRLPRPGTRAVLRTRQPVELGTSTTLTPCSRDYPENKPKLQNHSINHMHTSPYSSYLLYLSPPPGHKAKIAQHHTIVTTRRKFELGIPGRRGNRGQGRGHRNRIVLAIERTGNRQGEVCHPQGEAGDEEGGYADGEGDDDFDVQGHDHRNGSTRQ